MMCSTDGSEDITAMVQWMNNGFHFLGHMNELCDTN